MANMNNIPMNIVVHHSWTTLEVIDQNSEISFNNSHNKRGFPKSSMGWFIGYHYVIYSDPESKGGLGVRQYRVHEEVGAHCMENSMNFRSIGICLEGNFDNEEPNEYQKRELLKLIRELQKQYSIPDENVVPHRKHATYKSCWGNLLPDDIIGYLTDDLAPDYWKEGKDWAKEHEIVTGEHEAHSSVSWAAQWTVLHRLAERIMEWVKDLVEEEVAKQIKEQTKK